MKSKITPNQAIIKAVRDFATVQPLNHYSESIARIFRSVCINTDFEGLREDILKECQHLGECEDFIKKIESILQNEQSKRAYRE